jgi:hypothetical protein
MDSLLLMEADLRDGPSAEERHGDRWTGQRSCRHPMTIRGPGPFASALRHATLRVEDLTQPVGLGEIWDVW